MITFEFPNFPINTLEPFIYAAAVAAVGAIISLIVELLLTWHRAKIITIQKRSDEFIELSKKYYIPLALIVGGIEAETDPNYSVRPKILFFKIAKYLSLFNTYV